MDSTRMTSAFAALADPRRLAIVDVLTAGEHCVCDVSEKLGISNALASHHIKKLREAGLVNTRRRGAWLHCTLDTDAMEKLGEELSAFAMATCSGGGGCCSCATEAGLEATDD